MLATHKDAEHRYDEIRRLTLAAAEKDLHTRQGMADITLRTIDGEALAAAKAWPGSNERRVDWDWTAGYGSFRFRYPKRFELAIWQKSTLISLTLGRPTYNGTALRLDFIEAGPDKPADLKVFSLALFAMVTYADALDATEIRVMKPINETVRKYYESLGLTYVPKGNYLYVKL